MTPRGYFEDKDVGTDQPSDANRLSVCTWPKQIGPPLDCFVDRSRSYSSNSPPVSAKPIPPESC
jgi:hypothetical protein